MAARRRTISRNSSCIAASSYDAKAKELFISFVKPGRSYTYHDVPKSVANRLGRAGSKGRFFNANIRDSYDHS